MNYIVKLFGVACIIFSYTSIKAQNTTKPVLRQPTFTTSEVSNVKQISLLQEIYEIEDERNRIEKNQSLSSTERSSLLNEVNSSYKIKKQEFLNYVNSTGFSNIPEKEQLFYISLLKEDGKMEDYKKYIDLLKSSR